MDNLALACSGYNSRKYEEIEARDPLTGDMAPLFHPRQQDWNEHFSWTEDYTLILGNTPTGRAIAERLGFNREGVVNLRWALFLLGIHPPVDTP